MWHSEQSHVYGDRVLSLFIEFGDELMSGECPGAGAAAERELCQWEGLNADNLRLSLGIIAGGDIFKVVPTSETREESLASVGTYLRGKNCSLPEEPLATSGGPLVEKPCHNHVFRNE